MRIVLQCVKFITSLTNKNGFFWFYRYKKMNFCLRWNERIRLCLTFASLHHKYGRDFLSLSRNREFVLFDLEKVETPVTPHTRFSQTIGSDGFITFLMCCFISVIINHKSGRTWTLVRWLFVGKVKQTPKAMLVLFFSHVLLDSLSATLLFLQV